MLQNTNWVKVNHYLMQNKPLAIDLLEEQATLKSPSKDDMNSTAFTTTNKANINILLDESGGFKN